jgi:O-antigen ligase
MANKKLAKKITRLSLFVRNPSSLISHFLFWQVIVISIYLASRKREDFEPVLSNGLYLGTIAIATLALTLHLFLIRKDQKLDKTDLMYLTVFSLPTLILYLSMFVNHDFRSMQSITLIFILMAPIVIWKSDINLTDNQSVYKNIAIFSTLNLIFSLLQILNIIPVAQLNAREGVAGLGDRPTGLLFNAFAMSYSTLICIAIGLSLINKANKNQKLGVLIIVTSVFSLLLSGTRTSLWLASLILVSHFIFFNQNIARKIKVSIPILLVVVGAGAPFFLLYLGLKTGNSEWSTLNGRTAMWGCVTSKWEDFIPFGLGLDEAFPPQFCADSGWFSNLRHPENMFLLSLVESGPLGFMSYVLLFAFTIWRAALGVRQKNLTPIFITSIFLLSCLIYVSLFHYLPFLPERPADRGIYNFHLFYLIWVWYMKLNKEKLLK